MEHHVGVWYVAFIDTGGHHGPWHLFTRKGFRHCMCFTFLPGDKKDDGYWLVADSMIGYMEIRLLNGPGVDKIISYCIANGQIIAVHAGRLKPKERMRPLYCVTMVKSMIGDNSNAFTPYGLYKAIMARGGKRKFVG